MGLPKREGKKAKSNRFGGEATVPYAVRLPPATIDRINEDKIDVPMLVYQAIHTGSLPNGEPATPESMVKDRLRLTMYRKLLLLMYQENVSIEGVFAKEEEGAMMNEWSIVTK